MNTIYLTELLASHFQDKRIEESFGLPAVYVAKEELAQAARLLKEDNNLRFNLLVCETAVDKNTCFELVCHLRSLTNGYEMILKTQVEREALPMLPSLCGLWQAAELFEDEIYDLFGIRFENHPNLRRIMLDDDFKGYPLRKDFVNEQEL